MKLEPQATAIRESPALGVCIAECTATRLEEQAVSVVTDAPCQSRKYDMRFGRTAREVPAAN